MNVWIMLIVFGVLAALLFLVYFLVYNSEELRFLWALGLYGGFLFFGWAWIRYLKWAFEKE